MGAAALAIGLLQATGTAPAAASGAGWLVAYLVLIAGSAQLALGAGQTWLAKRGPAFELMVCEWGALNLGNVGIIAGSLLGSFWIVLAGTAAFVVALALFALGVRRSHHAAWCLAYRVVLALLFAAALVGLALAAGQFPH